MLFQIFHFTLQQIIPVQLHGSIVLKLIVVLLSVLQYLSSVGGSRQLDSADRWATYLLLLCARHYFKVTSPSFSR